MPLLNAKVQGDVTLKLRKTNGSFGPTEWGSYTLGLTSTIDVSDNNQAYIGKHTLAASGGTATIDLQSFANLAGETGIVLTEAVFLLLLVEGEDASVDLEAGASNGLVWYWTGAITKSAAENQDGIEFHYDPANPATVDNTHKTLKLTNNGSEEATATLVIIGNT